MAMQIISVAAKPGGQALKAGGGLLEADLVGGLHARTFKI
jgi:hypothetical protein